MAENNRNSETEEEADEAAAAAEEARTQLVYAIISNNIPEAIRLITPETANLKDKLSNNTPLHYACEGSGLESVVRKLLKNGADPNAKGDYGETPLHKSSSKTVSQLLLAAGAGINIMSKHGYSTKSDGTPLFYVIDRIYNDDPEEIKNAKVENALFLIQSGANLDTILLSRCNDKRLIDELVKRGVRINRKIKEYGNLTELHLACGENYNTATALLLIDMGADVNAVGLRNYTPLLMACRNNQTEVALRLIERGALINVKDKDDRTPFYWACENNNKDIARQLILMKATDVLDFCRDTRRVYDVIAKKVANEYNPVKEGFRIIMSNLVRMGYLDTILDRIDIFCDTLKAGNSSWSNYYGGVRCNSVVAWLKTLMGPYYERKSSLVTQVWETGTNQNGTPGASAANSVRRHLEIPIPRPPTRRNRRSRRMRGTRRV